MRRERGSKKKIRQAENAAKSLQLPSSRRQPPPATLTAQAAAKPAEKSAKMAGGARESDAMHEPAEGPNYFTRVRRR
jgi:hypothetical protein